MGHITQELDYPGHEAKGRGSSVALPVVDGVLGDAELLGDLPLQQAQIEPSLPQMVSQGLQLPRIAIWRWFPGC